jgi:hypothetical protein
MNEVVINVKAKNDSKSALTEARRDVKGLGDESVATGKKVEKFGEATRIAGERVRDAGYQYRNLSARSAEASQKSADFAKKAAEAEAEAKRLGVATAETARKIEDFKTASQRAANQAEELGDKAQRARRKIGELREELRLLERRNVEVKVDVDRDGALESKAEGLFAKIGNGLESLSEKIIGLLPDAFGSALTATGPIVQTALVALGAAIVATLSSFIAAGLAAGILAALGGGVLAAGIASALKSDKIDEILNGKKVITRSALNKKGDKTPNFGQDVESREGGLIPKLKDAFTNFGTPFVDPLARALDKVNDALDKAGPKLDALAQKFAPLIDKLAPALMDMADKAWPGISAAIDASLPLFDTLSQYLPVIGEAIGSFFQTIADHGPAAQRAFGQILTLVGSIIVAASTLMDWLLGLYEKIMWIKDALSHPIFGNFLPGPIQAVGNLIELLERAVGLKHDLEGSISGSGRTLPSGGAAVGGALGSGNNAGLHHRASGGIAGGLTQVAERGGELLKLPQGTMVYASGQSQQMLAQAANSGPHRTAVELRVTGNGGLFELLMNAQRSGDLQILSTAIV